MLPQGSRAYRLLRSVAVALCAAVLAACVVEVLSRLGARMLPGGEPVLEGGYARFVFGGAIVIQLAAALFLAVPRLVRGARTEAPSWWRGLIVAAYGAGTALLALRPAAAALTSGAWISHQPYVDKLRLGMVAGGSVAFALFLVLWFGWRWFERRCWRVALGLLTLVVGAGAVVVNVIKLPGQYPEAHLLLMAFGAIAVQLVFHEILRWIVGTWHRTERAVLAVAAAILVGGSACVVMALPVPTKVISHLLLDSPRAAYVLNFVLPAREGTDLLERLQALDFKRPYVGASRAPKSRLQIGDDWNVLLIVVDAMRADAIPPSRDTYPKHRFGKETAPFLTGLVGRSYRFSRAYSGATYTALSMPSMFRSHWAAEDPTTGRPIASVMGEHGRVPIALVNDYFTEPWNKGVRAMLEGFAEIDVYPEKNENEHLGQIKDALARHKEHPFFAWIHYYACHSPGWNGAVLKNGQSWLVNYPRALNWVDDQIRQVFDELEKQGMADRTLVVITSDHGEGLMDTGQMSHGTTILEELSRVPLTIYFPGRPGALIDRTVGNVDILPTLVELMGGMPERGERGESLVPLLLDKNAPWDKSYVLVSGTENYAGVVRGSKKHIFDLKTGMHMHFDLDKDPLEDHEEYDPLDSEQRDLLGTLVEQSPEYFTSELSNEKTQKALDERLAQVNGRHPPESLPFLLDLIRLAPTPSRIAWAKKLFETTDNDRVRLDILEQLFAADPSAWEGLVERRLKQLQDTDGEAPFVADLAVLRLPEFSRSYVASRFLAVSSRSEKEWSPWLSLLSTWNLNRPEEAQALAQILKGALPSVITPPRGSKMKPVDLDAMSVDSSIVRLVLETVLRLDRQSMAPEVRAELASYATLLLDHPRVAVAAAACRTLGHVGDRATAESLLRNRLDEQPLLIRLRALEGLVELVGKDALPEVMRLGRKSGFIITAIDLVGEIGDPAGEPFLRWALRKGPGRKLRTRLEVRKARKAIRAHMAEQAAKAAVKKNPPPTAPTP